MHSSDRGQSVVLLAFAMVALLAFTGLAIDAGVIYSGKVNLSRAVDAAALAGVVDLPHDRGDADATACAFLGANGIGCHYDEDTDECIGCEMESGRGFGTLGAYQYAITVTQQIDLYFLPAIGFEHAWLKETAIAEINPAVNLYVSQSGVYGEETTVNLAVFGPNACTCFGDPYSPRYGRGTDGFGCDQRVPNPWWSELKGVYHFRLDIPGDYESTAERLTKRWNKDLDTNSVVRVEIFDPDCYNASAASASCGQRSDPCALEVSDGKFVFWRVDEQRGPYCDPASSSDDWTRTVYALYYYNGRFVRKDLARYVAGYEPSTDLLWVVPPGFEIEIPEDIYVAPDGTRSLFLDVQTISGSSENVFDLWAGPRYLDVPDNVNERNEYLIDVVHAHDSAGAVWFGVGRVPQNSVGMGTVQLTLAYLPPEWAGRQIVVSAFDNDLNLAEALTVTIDSCPNWSAKLELSGNGLWRDNVITLPSQPFDTFYGGYLQVMYTPSAAQDTFGWKITTEANPRLVE